MRFRGITVLPVSIPFTAKAETCSSRAQTCVVKWGAPRAACFDQFRLAACEKTGKYVAPNGNVWPASRGKGPTLKVERLRAPIPDKAMTQPSLGRETVSVCSILHDELEKPRRCGRIAGCRAFNLPQGMCARLFAGALRSYGQSSPRSWLKRTISSMKIAFCLSSRLANNGSAASATLR